MIGPDARLRIQVGPQGPVEQPPGPLPTQVKGRAVPGKVQILGLSRTLVVVQKLGVGQPLVVFQVQVAVYDDRLPPLLEGQAIVAERPHVPGAIVAGELVASRVFSCQVDVPISAGRQLHGGAGTGRRLYGRRVARQVNLQQGSGRAAAVHRRVPGDGQRRRLVKVGPLRRAKGDRVQPRENQVVNREHPHLDGDVARLVAGPHPGLVADEILACGRLPGQAPLVAVHGGREP